MTITALPTAPSRTQDPDTFDANVDAFVAALPTFVTEANALAAAMNLNSTTDTSASSVLIGLGAKTFTVSASKSFIGGMWLSISDTSAPSTNSMLVQVTSYSGTTLVVNCVSFIGSGTIAAWTIAMTAYGLSSSSVILGRNFAPAYTTTVTSATTIVLTSESTFYQDLTGSTAQTITLPVVSTLTTGHSFCFDNDSTATVTINSSGGNLVLSLPAGAFAKIVCVLATGTTATSWSVRYSNSATTWYSSSYTPTITNGTNVAASTAYANSNYTIVGQYCHVLVIVDIDPTAAGAFDFEISTPIASAFTVTRQAGGSAHMLGATAVNSAIVLASAANKVKVSGFVADTGNLQWRVNFRMQII